jgi:hypothetical protein
LVTGRYRSAVFTLKLPFTTTQADGRVGWICDDPLGDGETKKRTLNGAYAARDHGMTIEQKQE